MLRCWMRAACSAFLQQVPAHVVLRWYDALPCVWLDAGAGSIWLQSRHAVASCDVRVRGWRVVMACSWVLRSARRAFGVGEMKKSAFAFGSVSVSLRIMLTDHALGRVSVSSHIMSTDR